jgi:hypothetical protein
MLVWSEQVRGEAHPELGRLRLVRENDVIAPNAECNSTGGAKPARTICVPPPASRTTGGQQLTSAADLLMLEVTGESR